MAIGLPVPPPRGFTNACSPLCASITLPNCAAVSGAAWTGEQIYAVDGLSPRVYVFRSDGLYLDRFRAIRVYRTVRFDDINKNRFAATDVSCSPRVFILNSRFEEIGGVALETQTFSDRIVLDAGYNRDGSGFLITHPFSLRVYALDGSYVSTVTRNPVGRQFLHWAEFGLHRALNYTENDRTYITVDRVGGIFPECVALKAFIPMENNLYGAFNVGFIYTYFIPIYENGALNTSIFGSFSLIADNISTGCCN